MKIINLKNQEEFNSWLDMLKDNEKEIIENYKKVIPHQTTDKTIQPNQTQEIIWEQILN